MNTINSVTPYVNLRNNYQIATIQQAPAFKGKIGRSVVNDINIGRYTTAESVLKKVGGPKLSYDKVSDVLEELINRIKFLEKENKDLEHHLTWARHDLWSITRKKS